MVYNMNAQHRHTVLRSIAVLVCGIGKIGGRFVFYLCCTYNMRRDIGTCGLLVLIKMRADGLELCQTYSQVPR